MGKTDGEIRAEAEAERLRVHARKLEEDNAHLQDETRRLKEPPKKKRSELDEWMFGKEEGKV